MLFSRLLIPASSQNLVSFTANFSKHLLVLCPRRVPRNEEDQRNNNAKSNCDGKSRKMECTWKRRANSGREEAARSDEMKRKGGKRERAGVFAIIIIAGFLPRMLQKQQVAVLARATRNRTDKSFGITTNRNRSPVISEPRWRLDYHRRLKGDLDCTSRSKQKRYWSRPFARFERRFASLINDITNTFSKNMSKKKRKNI